MRTYGRISLSGPTRIFTHELPGITDGVLVVLGYDGTDHVLARAIGDARGVRGILSSAERAYETRGEDDEDQDDEHGPRCGDCGQIACLCRAPLACPSWAAEMAAEVRRAERLLDEAEAAMRIAIVLTIRARRGIALSRTAGRFHTSDLLATLGQIEALRDVLQEGARLHGAERWITSEDLEAEAAHQDAAERAWRDDGGAGVAGDDCPPQWAEANAERGREIIREFLTAAEAT